ncbi:MAG: hypothetical protein J6R47_03060 [Acholeplasmatales bacterium]|nr:hypothetical protein [Acholeplasmatales bacterium]
MKKMSYNDKSHLYGQIFLAIAIVIVLAIPVLMAVVLKVMPNFKVIGGSMVALLFFLLGGIIEVITYAPMLGVQGTYLGFFTGNLVNLKVPCAVNAREMVNAKPGTKEAEIVSTISVSISTIVTTVIMTIGVALIVPLTPILESEALAPAFDTAFIALFSALAYKYFIKDPKLVPVPLFLAVILIALIPGIGNTLIPIVAVVAILFAYWLFRIAIKKGKSL